MPLCFLCHRQIDISNLRSHFQLLHNRHDFTRYQCIENDCGRYFNLYSSFTRHWKKTHSTPVLHDIGRDCEISELLLDPSTPSQTTATIIDDSLPDACVPDVNRSLAVFFASLYADATLPRKVTQTVADGLREFMSNSLAPSLERALQNLVSTDVLSSELKTLLLETLLPIINSPFEHLRTEHVRLKYYRDAGTFFEPEAVRIGERMERIRRKGIMRISHVPCHEYFIPLRKILKTFFSLPDILAETLAYMRRLNEADNDCIANFIQGSFWKEKMSSPSRKNLVCLPLFCFFDDYESGNVLGSRSGVHKLGAVYVSIPCLPPSRVSLLSNIFLVLLFHASDRTAFGNLGVFQPVIDEFNYLSINGIEYDMPDFKGTIYFELGLILGDNLGVHSISGFVESFSSNFPCRVCRVRKEAMKIQCLEDESLLRNVKNYETDLEKKDPSATGVRERCVWLNVRGFDLFSQIGCDVMHDILEGVAKYVMSVVLIELTKAKFFSLAYFNTKINTFSYGPDNGNKPFPLIREHLVAGNVRLSASEMLTLIRYFPLFVGDKVPRGNKVWKLYLGLRAVVDVLLSPSFVKGTEYYLQTLVEELNQMYIEVSQNNLKPKFHNLLHYYRAMTQFGPVVHFWSMRFEAKHRLSKMSARASSSRVNLTLSLALKQQLKLNEIFIKGKLNDVIRSGPSTDDLSLFHKVFLTRELSLDLNSFSLVEVAWISVSSVSYKKGTILVYDSKPREECEEVVFMSSDKFFLYDSNKLIITGYKYQTLEFDEHLVVFEVVTPSIPEYVAVFYDSLPSQVPHSLNAHSNSKTYITLRSAL